MNIGIDIRCLMDKNRTGVGEYTFGLLDAIFKIDKENQFFLFYNSHKDISANLPKWEQENVHYIHTRWSNKLLNFCVWLFKRPRLDKLVISKWKLEIKKLPITNYQLPITHLDIFFSPNLNFTNLSKGVRHIQTVHDLSFEFLPECFTWKQRLWHWFLNPRKQCQRAEVIIVPSENTRQDIEECFQVLSSKFQVIKPGLSCNLQLITYNLEQVKKKYNLSNKYILYLGTLEPRKNVETIIEAYKRCCSMLHVPCSMILAGSQGWKNKKLMQLIKNTPGVKYLGYVNEAEKTALFKNASLFVFPSLYEGFGLPVLEAMANGVPVITSNRSSLLEVGQNAVCYVNPHNVSELVSAMELVLKNDKLKNMMIGKGLKVVKGFEWGKAAEKLLEILKNSSV